MPNLINQISVLGNLRVAGALILDKDNSDFPSNPAPGTLAIVGLSLYAYISIAGVQSWYPLVEQAMGTANYLHTQVTPATTWTINHNLNTSPDQIWYQIHDASNVLIDANQFVAIDNNSFQLVFTTPQSGKCILVGTTHVIIDNAEITDGTTVKIHGYANRPLGIVAGAGMDISFDDDAKTITFKATEVTQSGDSVSSTLTAIENSVGLNTNGTYVQPTSSAYINSSITLSNADLLLDAAIAAEHSRATTAEATLTTNLGTETTARISAYSTLVTELDAEVTNRSNAISAEAATRSSANNTISTALATETNRATTAEGLLVPKTTTVNGYALSGNVTVSASDVGLGNVSNTSDANKPVSTATATAIGVETARAITAEALLAPLAGSLSNDFAINNLAIAGNITPNADNVSNIGSPTHRFNAAYIGEVHLNTNTLYLGSTPILGTTDTVINIVADVGQSINIATSGIGSTLLTSAQGVELLSTGVGSNVVVQANGIGSQILFNAQQAIAFTAPTVTTYGNSVVTGTQTVTGSLTVTGNLNVNGATTTVNSTTVTTQDNIIEVNHGQVGNGVTAGLAGLSVNRGDAPFYQMVYDESVQMFRVGMVGSLETIASQPYVATNYAPVSHTHSLATTSVSGFLSAADKTKLDSVAAIASVSALSAETTRATAAEAAISASITTIQNTANGAISSTGNSLPLTNGTISSNILTTSTLNANQVLNSFSASVCRSAEYLLQITYGTQYQVAKLMCLQDGTNTYITELADMFTNNNPLANFDSTISGDNFQLLVNPLYTGLTIKVIRTTINI